MRFAPHAISGERDSSATGDRRRDAKRAMGSRGREIELDDIAILRVELAPNVAVQPMVALPLKRTLRRRARSAAVGGLSRSTLRQRMAAPAKSRSFERIE